MLRAMRCTVLLPPALRVAVALRVALTPLLAAAPLVALTPFVGADPLAAQIPPRSGESLTVHPEARAAIQGLRSPFCPGQMLEVCTSGYAAQLRDSIQHLAEAGLSSESIIEAVVAEYGEEWRAEPLRRGLGLWAWVVPPVGLLGALGLVALVLAGRRRAPGPAPVNELTPAVEARLKAALQEIEEAEEPDW